MPGTTTLWRLRDDRTAFEPGELVIQEG